MILELDDLISEAVQAVGVCAYRFKRPDDANPPFITYQEISEIELQNVTLCDGLRSTLVQIDVYSQKYDRDLQAIATAVLSLQGKASGKVNNILFENVRELYDDELYRLSYEFNVFYNN
jgi:hypothetical protein